MKCFYSWPQPSRRNRRKATPAGQPSAASFFLGGDRELTGGSDTYFALLEGTRTVSVAADGTLRVLLRSATKSVLVWGSLGPRGCCPGPEGICKGYPRERQSLLRGCARVTTKRKRLKFSVFEAPVAGLERMLPPGFRNLSIRGRRRNPETFRPAVFCRRTSGGIRLDRADTACSLASRAMTSRRGVRGECQERRSGTRA